MATGPTEFIDNTTTDVFRPELWSMKAIVARESALVFGRLVNVDFREAMSFGDLIHVPSVSNLSARSKSENTAVDFETNTESNTDITINQHKYVAIAVESITKVQNNRDQLALYAGKLGYALSLDVDDVLAGLPDDSTNTVGTLAVELQDEDFLRAIQYLNDADVPEETRYFIISNAQQTGVLKLDRFVHNDYSQIHGDTPASLAVERAYVTSFLNQPIYRSSNVEGTNNGGHDNTFFHRESWALVMQMTPTSHSQFDIDFLADKIVIEQLYGTKEMRDDHAVWMKGA